MRREFFLGISKGFKLLKRHWFELLSIYCFPHSINARKYDTVFSLSIAWRWMLKYEVFSNDFIDSKKFARLFCTSLVHLVSETNAIAYYFT